MKNYTNHLIHETSPYLLQHAHNPVNWYAWNETSLQKAKEEDKPILLSIGYSACHWCHVMERESFEDEATAAIMNENFINIKVDREERPDIDQLYMDAVQALTGSGGWPLNVFLTPDLKPFYGGTYFPPQRAFNRSSWKEVLLSVAQAFSKKRKEIDEQAENITAHLVKMNSITTGENAPADKITLTIISKALLKLSDKTWGGFGQAPKFPQTFSIIFLLRHYHFTGDELSFETGLKAIDKMMKGGIYDHIGGGFARYSTDERWQAPHFEKMLYDNALLVDVYSEAYRLTKKKDYADVINQTIEFIQREMTAAAGGFYSALDADSEGVEGKFYTWNKSEIDDVLKEKSNLFCAAYDISETGNWEHTNIIWQPDDLKTIALQNDISDTALYNHLELCKTILMKEREKRTRPGLDNKVLCGWNALMIEALCNASSSVGKPQYLDLALSNLRFIEKYLTDMNGSLLHSWNKTINHQTGFLDDYAAVIRAYIALHQITSDKNYLLKAKALTEKVEKDFSEETGIFFHFTQSKQKDVLLRKTEIYDGATPSGNALMADNLMKLSIFFDIAEWKTRAEKMILKMARLSEKYPTTFGFWNLNLQQMVVGLKEIAIVGKDYLTVLKNILGDYYPNTVLQASPETDSDWPLLKEKTVSNGQTSIYICENYQCLKPFKNYSEMISRLSEHF
ncbi:MAG: thioredoxin domain-containing protein [Bacteroidetes bacterium]|nr:thioredoxin domain-containing protein [Bacteroidota bacterium]